MTFKKGYDPKRKVHTKEYLAEIGFQPGSGEDRDPRISPYSEGDGRKRRKFKKGEVANPNLAEHQFEEGNIEASKKDTPKVWSRRAELIPAEFQADIQPSDTGVELVKYLDETIVFARAMHEMVARTTNLDNNKAVGRFTASINHCIDTRAKILGGKIDPAPYGDLSAKNAEQTKDDLAHTLKANMAKMAHSVHFARQSETVGDDGLPFWPNVFKEDGAIETWAGDGFLWLIGGTRKTIEMRARLDAWEQREQKSVDPLMQAFKNRKSRRDRKRS